MRKARLSPFDSFFHLQIAPRFVTPSNDFGNPPALDYREREVPCHRVSHCCLCSSRAGIFFPVVFFKLGSPKCLVFRFLITDLKVVTRRARSLLGRIASLFFVGLAPALLRFEPSRALSVFEMALRPF